MTTNTQEPKKINVTTAAGIARFPSLDKADTKFKASGEYKTGIILSRADAQPILDALTKMGEEMLVATKARLEESLKTETNGEKKGKIKKALADLKLADLPVKPVFDDDGNETGDVILNFKMNAQRTDKKTGKNIVMVPKLFDGKGKPMPATPVWGGSTIKVAGQVVPFYTQAVGAGASLRLSAVQIINLVNSNSAGASSFGFGVEEGGYEAGDHDDTPTPDDEASDFNAPEGGDASGSATEF